MPSGQDDSSSRQPLSWLVITLISIQILLVIALCSVVLPSYWTWWVSRNNEALAEEIVDRLKREFKPSSSAVTKEELKKQLDDLECKIQEMHKKEIQVLKNLPPAGLNNNSAPKPKGSSTDSKNKSGR